MDKGYLQTCKKHIDFIYELTKEGYDGSMSSFGSATLTKVSAELVSRGVLKKSRKGVHVHYVWAANCAPTETFYKNVAKSISDHQKEIDTKRRSKVENQPAIVVEKNRGEPLSSYSIQELWDELKSRGVQIEDNKLVVIKKTYFV